MQGHQTSLRLETDRPERTDVPFLRTSSTSIHHDQFLIGFAWVGSGSTDLSLGLTVQCSAFSDDTTLAKPTRYFDDPDQFACDYFGRDFAFPLEIYGVRGRKCNDWGTSWDIHRLVSRILLGGPELQASDFRLSGPGSGSTFLMHVASSGKSLSILNAPYHKDIQMCVHSSPSI